MRTTPVSTISARARRPLRSAALVAAVALVLSAAGCSDDGDEVAERAEDAASAPRVADACVEAQAFVSALDELLTADVVAIGTDGIRERIVTVADAWEDLRPAVAASHEEETDELIDAVRELRSVDLANGAARAVVAYGEAVGEVREAWGDLRGEIRDDLDGCDLSSDAAAAN